MSGKRILMLAGDIPRDLGHPIRSLDADGILAREARRLVPSLRCLRSPDTLNGRLSFPFRPNSCIGTPCPHGDIHTWKA